MVLLEFFFTLSDNVKIPMTCVFCDINMLVFDDFSNSPYFCIISSLISILKSFIREILPQQIILSSITAFKPLPDIFSKSETFLSSKSREFAFLTIAFPIGWFEFISTDAARMIKSSSRPWKTIISSTSGLPSVIVPVLSKAATSIWPAFSKVSPFLISIPYSAALPTPTVTAVGGARPSAQGHATTRIEIKHVRQNSNVSPKTRYHIKNTIIAIVKITGMK